MQHLKPIDDLDYSNFKLSCSEDKLKDILKCTCVKASELDIEEINRRIKVLRYITNNNIMDYNTSECWQLGNMKSNYQYILKIKQNNVDK